MDESTKCLLENLKKKKIIEPQVIKPALLELENFNANTTSYKFKFSSLKTGSRFSPYYTRFKIDIIEQLQTKNQSNQNRNRKKNKNKNKNKNTKKKTKQFELCSVVYCEQDLSLPPDLVLPEEQVFLISKEELLTYSSWDPNESVSLLNLLNELYLKTQKIEKIKKPLLNPNINYERNNNLNNNNSSGSNDNDNLGNSRQKDKAKRVQDQKNEVMVFTKKALAKLNNSSLIFTYELIQHCTGFDCMVDLESEVVSFFLNITENKKNNLRLLLTYRKPYEIPKIKILDQEKQLSQSEYKLPKYQEDTFLLDYIETIQNHFQNNQQTKQAIKKSAKKSTNKAKPTKRYIVDCFIEVFGNPIELKNNLNVPIYWLMQFKERGKVYSIFLIVKIEGVKPIIQLKSFSNLPTQIVRNVKKFQWLETEIKYCVKSLKQNINFNIKHLITGIKRRHALLLKQLTEEKIMKIRISQAKKMKKK
ncbi:brisc and brca1-a complex member [Anaeramoeba flamelloides]|uniref:Brisc and brca1-a complex member n=1 Tax=Anaeramoeba flamelloides TaxID=1746091 RepID=A0AAV7ZCM4_9EUKA|nr:brisc and brca1-a complex member [Anaeramoeba flamelloides]